MQHDLFGGTNYRYIAIISPDETTITAVRKLKHLLNDFIPLTESTLHSIPHVTLGYCDTVDTAE